MDFSSAIKLLRVNSLMSQTDFAKAIGVAYSTVNRWENGKASPNFQTMKRIYEFCSVNGYPLNFDQSTWRGVDVNPEKNR